MRNKFKWRDKNEEKNVKCASLLDTEIPGAGELKVEMEMDVKVAKEGVDEE